MVSIIDQLTREHENLGVLLDILERECQVLGSGSSPQLDLIQLILDYLREYPSISHHAKEDAIFTCLTAQVPGHVAAIGDLLREHDELGVRTKVLRDMVGKLAQGDNSLDHDGVRTKLRGYINSYRRHIDLEEGYFLPTAKQFLTLEDIDRAARSVPGPDDPDYPGEAAKVVEILRAEIMCAAARQTLA